MRSEWWVYAAVGGIAAAAGIAIAGLPDDSSVSSTVVVVQSAAGTSSTTTSTTTIASATTPAPTTTVAASSTAPPATATPPATSAAPATTVLVLVPRQDLFVVVANGSGIAGLAGRTAAQLLDLGYTDTAVTDGLEFVDESIVYFAPGLVAEAARLALELGLPAAAVAPIEGAPSVEGDAGGAGLLPYLGRDRA